MSDGPIPKTWREAIPFVWWGVLIFASGFEVVVEFVDGEYKKSGIAAGLLVAFVVLALNWRRWFGRFLPHWLIEGAALEILFDKTNPNRKFWSLESAFDNEGKPAGSYWQYRVAIKNKSSRTVRNVTATVEATGPMPTRPEPSLFDLNKQKVIDLNPGQDALAVLRTWWYPARVVGVAIGPDLYGPIKMIASADDVSPCTKLFHFDPEREPMIYEFEQIPGVDLATDSFISMEEAARRTFEAVEHLPNAPRASSPEKVIEYYSDLLRWSVKMPVYGCAPGSRNKREIPPDQASKLYHVEHDNYDVSKLWRLGNKKNPAYTEVCVKESDLVRAIQVVVTMVKSAAP